MTSRCQPGSVCVPALHSAPLKQLLFPGGPCTVLLGPFCSQRCARTCPTSKKAGRPPGLCAAASPPPPGAGLVLVPLLPPLPCPSPWHLLLPETSGSSAFIFQLLLSGLGCMVGRAASSCLSQFVFLRSSLPASAAGSGALRTPRASFPSPRGLTLAPYAPSHIHCRLPYTQPSTSVKYFVSRNSCTSAGC